MVGTGAGGTWQGSIVDVCGYQGSLELELTVQGTAVSGRFAIAIADRGAPFTCEGELSGTSAGGLELHFAFGPTGEEGRVDFRGSVLGLSDGGAGICGTYDVTTPSFSPFRAGVVALYRDATPAVEVQIPVLGPAGGGG